MAAASASSNRPESVPATSTCNALKKRGGGICTLPAGWGTPHQGFDRCKLHGGTTPAGMKHAAKLQAAALAAEADARLAGDGRALELVVDPFDAVLRMLYKAAGWEAFCTRKVVELEESTLLVDHERVTQTTGGDGSTRVERTNERALHIWIVEQQRARAEVARLAKIAIDAGVAERYVRVAEHTADLIARFIDGVFDDLGLTAAQLEKAPTIVRRHLQLLEQPSAAA